MDLTKNTNRTRSGWGPRITGSMARRICRCAVVIVSLGLLAQGGLAQSTPRSELSPQELRRLEREEAQRLRQLERSADLRVARAVALQTACENGDFESGLNSTQWSGGHGRVGGHPALAGVPLGDPDFDNFTPGLLGGMLSLDASHQTWVQAGLDPTVGISQVAPVGLNGVVGDSTHAVRLGNMAKGWGSELLSKTFTVTSAESVIRFWYAIVVENPGGHGFREQPSFWVRVLDTAGVEIPGAVNLVNNSPKAVADSTNPFFQEKAGSSPLVLYRDWSCAEIDLSDHIGETVTVQFVTEDCAQGAHYGYAYVDNFCGTCQGDPSGSISFDQGASSNCGPGNLCLDYTLPAVGTTTGTAVIELELLQNGTVVHSLTSPALTSGSQHCFNIDPDSIPGLSKNPSHFDFVATAQFSIGKTELALKSVGSKPNGTMPGRNNDYRIECSCNYICCLGPCCVKGTCIETTEKSCNALKGIFHPTEAECALGYCQLDKLCFPTSKTMCESKNGVWLGADPCPQPINL